jgi:hypothetical protein
MIQATIILTRAAGLGCWLNEQGGTLVFRFGSSWLVRFFIA